MKIDIHNSKKKLLSKINYIKSSTELSKRNKKYLLDFVDYCVADGLVDSRTLNYLQTLVRITKALNKDLKRVKKKDLIKFLKMIEESNYSTISTKGRGYTSSS